MKVIENEPMALVNAVSEILDRFKHPDPRAWEAKLHPDARITPDINIQRFLINRYWREEISTYPGSTMMVRYCLDDQCDIKDWLRLFQEGVITCILQNTPPRNNS